MLPDRSMLQSKTHENRRNPTTKPLQLTIRGSGKHKQTITKLLALPGGIKTYTFRNSGGDTVQTKLSRRSPQD